MPGLLAIPPRVFGFDLSGSIAPTHIPPELAPFIRDLATYLDSVYATLSRALRVMIQVTQVGSLTVSDVATTGTFTFPTTATEPDTVYFVTAVPVTVTGAAAAGASRVRSVSKATTGVTITVEAAPGAGTSVTFDVSVLRNPTP